MCRLTGTDDGTSNAEAQAALLEAGVRFARLPLLCFGDGNIFGDDIDVCLRSHDVTADLAVGFAGHDVHIAIDAADSGACSAGAGDGLVSALHAAADGHAYSGPTSEESAAGALAKVLFAGCFFDRDDVDMAPGLQGCAVVRDDMAASHGDVPPCADGDGVAAQAAALRLGLMRLVH